MDTKKLLYIFISFAVTFVLFILGFFAFIPKGIEVSSPDQSSVPQAECVGAGCGSKGVQDEVALEGVVRTLQDNQPQSYGTHQLEGDNGMIIAILKTDDDKLKMVEGTWVEVRGTIVQKSPQGTPVVNVKDISFKND